MTLLQKIYFGNTLLAWLSALGLSLAVLSVLILLKRTFLHRVAAFAQKTETLVDDLVVEVLGGTRFFALLIVALYVGTRILVVRPGTEAFIRTTLIVALLIQGALWGSRAITFLLTQTMEKRKDGDAASATALGVMGFAAKMVLWTLFLLLMLDNLGVNVTGLVAGLGVGGIAVALAVQNVLGDLFASLSIVLDKPFVIGDFLIVGEHLGTVEHVGLKSTRIRSLSGEQLVFANADLLKSRIRNFKRMEERRVVFSIGVTYQTSHQQLASIGSMLKEIVEGNPGVRFDRAHFKEFGDSALVFEVVYYLLDPDYNLYMDVQQAINLEIFRRFEAEGIAFAYPTQTLYLAGDHSKTLFVESRRSD